MAPPKGKQATKGQKQIYEENKSTLRFYGIMALVAESLYLLSMVTFFWSDFTFLNWCLCGLSIASHAGSLQFMSYMARASFGETGALVDGGIDLNMEAGIAEHLKDLIILTSGVQLAAVISNYFWLLWLLAPGRALYLLWVNILGPWFFQEAPPEMDEKKQKKLERKARRH